MRALYQRPFFMSQGFKIPESVLVVIHTRALDVLLLRRADSSEYWQSVTGSKDHVKEPWVETAAREVLEETGLDCRPGAALASGLEDWMLENVYEIYPQWLHRYAPGVRLNTEHVFGLTVPERAEVRLSPREHTDSMWLPYREAADRCHSASNAEAILHLPRMLRSWSP